MGVFAGALALPALPQIDESSFDIEYYVDAQNGLDENPGTAEAPFRQIRTAINLLNETAALTQSAKIHVATGVYREQFQMANREVTTVIEGVAPGEVIITGADVVTDWTETGSGIYTTPWLFEWGAVTPPSTVSLTQAGRRSEMVFINDQLLDQVATVEELYPGSYHVSNEEDLIRMMPFEGQDPLSETVEVSTRNWVARFLFNDHLVLRNLVFEKAASGDMHASPGTYSVGFFGDPGANQATNELDDPERNFSEHILIENVDFRWMNQGGAIFANMKHVLGRNVRFNHNGVEGMSINRSQDLVWIDCEFNYNNWRWGRLGGAYGWIPTGTKHLHTDQSFFINCEFIGNYGAGLWMDFGNENINALNISSVHNFRNGLYYEANSGPMHVEKMLLRDNGHRMPTPWGVGLLYAEASNLTVHDSALLRNEFGQIAPRLSERVYVDYWSGERGVGGGDNLRVTLSTFDGSVSQQRDKTIVTLNDTQRQQGMYALSPDSPVATMWTTRFVPGFTGVLNAYNHATTTFGFRSAQNQYNPTELSTWQKDTGSDQTSTFTQQTETIVPLDAFLPAADGVFSLEAEEFQYMQSDESGLTLEFSSVNPGFSAGGYVSPQSFDRTTGLTKPVATNIHHLIGAEGGTYATWVRYRSEAGGRVALQVDEGEGTETVLAGTVGWEWLRGPDLVLPAGDRVALSLLHGEGDYGIDRILLVPDTLGLDPTIVALADLPRSSLAWNEAFPYSVFTVDPLLDESTPAGAATFRLIRRDISAADSIALSWSGSASDEDFAEPLPESVAFVPGQMMALVTLPFADDTIPENLEDLTLSISDAHPGSATVLIAASDLVQTLSTVFVSSGTPATATVVLGNPGSADVTLDLGISGKRIVTSREDKQLGLVLPDFPTNATVITELNRKDDATSAALPMGIDFPFYGSAFPSVRVCTNGFLSFTSGRTDYTALLIPSAGAVPNLVAPLWMDLRMDSTSKILRASQPGEWFAIEWRDMIRTSGAGTGRQTFRVWLFANGTIAMEYPSVNALDLTYSIGIQNSDGSDGVSLAYATDYVESGLILLFADNATGAALEFDQVTVSPGEFQEVGLTLDPMLLPPGNFFSLPLTVTPVDSDLGQSVVNVPIQVSPFRYGNVTGVYVDDWMGWVADQYPYLYSIRHGWLIAADGSLDWLYHQRLGWLFASRDSYPYFYGSPLGWIYLPEDSGKNAGD
jgi:hypothetical protein